MEDIPLFHSEAGKMIHIQFKYLWMAARVLTPYKDMKQTQHLTAPETILFLSFSLSLSAGHRQGPLFYMSLLSLFLVPLECGQSQLIHLNLKVHAKNSTRWFQTPYLSTLSIHTIPLSGPRDFFFFIGSSGTAYIILYPQMRRRRRRTTALLEELLLGVNARSPTSGKSRVRGDKWRT
ncbi:hypothetical protein M432DRAFT_265336 [Thermoascus aurantiacus ATCC 26904]